MATTQERSPSKSKKRITAAAVPKTMIEKASLTLADLPEKPRDTLKLREAIQLLVEPITAALAKGYSQEEIATLLKDKGIDITPASLQYYLLRFRQKPNSTRQKTRKSKRSTTSSAVETPTSSTTVSLEAPSESASVPKAASTETKRRSSTKGTSTSPTTRRTAAKTKPLVAETVVESTAVEPEKPAKTAKTTKTTKTAVKTPSTRSASPSRKPRSSATKSKAN